MAISSRIDTLRIDALRSSPTAERSRGARTPSGATAGGLARTQRGFAPPAAKAIEVVPSANPCGGHCQQC
jgi:hypothetical protein